jgi:hypothetical protein
MKKFYKIVNGLPQIGSGTVIPNGFTEYTTEPQELVTALALQDTNNLVEITNAEARAYLASTDWLIIRLQETGEAVPSEILTLRAEARLKVV